MDEPSKPADSKKYRVTRESVVSHSAAWEASATKKYERVGRDSDRIEPFLQRFAQIWTERPQFRFGEMVASAVGDTDPYALEDDQFHLVMEEWTVIHPPELGDPSRIQPFIDVVSSFWTSQPDLRFGQLVTNFARKDDDLADVSDEDFLSRVQARLDKDSSTGEP